MKRKNILIILLLPLFLLSFPSFGVYSEKNELEFRVEPIFPKSQIGNSGYYHFKETPNKTVTLQARVKNDSKNPLELTLQALNAYSGNQGILYGEKPVLEGTNITKDEFQFKKVVTSPNEISLGPLESKVIEFTVKIPDIKGTLLGSIEFRLFKGTEELTGKNENSQLLVDQYKAVNIGVQIDVEDYKTTPSLHLGKPHFSPEQISIMIPMENKQPAIISNIQGTYKITKNDDDAFLLTGDIPTFSMAPMTVFFYPIQWTGSPLETGTYHIASTLTVNGNAKKNLEHSFKIENKEIKETQEKQKARGEIQVKSNTFPWMIVLIGILVLIIVGLLWVVLRLKPQKKE
ncbi:WxL protein host-binding domain-containing protein [Niallia sp. NCCP-28]|uniref:WxL protein host-binding domain-containing protein n=1 Tax=Niallia sp. NCCP-28 TaxID=2934712 RepID=UPI00208A193A|nr:DUF3324 domain-containing protein [Niallia sp. NCCP-28]GKU83583.1 hypothetical protein NCCP28_29790 [Niallia sp. NCCP-28]